MNYTEIEIEELYMMLSEENKRKVMELIEELLMNQQN